MAKKIIVIIFSVLIFNTCMGMTTKQYSYQTDKKDNTINIVGQLILKNGVNITDDEFVVYLGKIELDTGEIIKLPPLHFKKYVYITKGSILNTINPNGKFNQYYNTVEEYKKNGWKEE